MNDKHNSESEPRHFAAIDLGSNSFHMLVVRQLHDDVQPLFKHKERVRLAEGLDAKNNLSEEAIERGVSVLKTFAEQLTPFPNCTVRVVGTHTLRIAKNRSEFLASARQVFPYPIEIISGQEEARLVHLGVSSSEHLAGNTLVIDIGGGSTEVALGRENSLELGRSHTMGSVSFTEAFFSKGVDKASYKKAKLYAQQQLERFSALFSSIGWNQVRCTSGTAQAIAVASENLGYDSKEISAKSIKALRKLVVKNELSSKVVKGISEQRLQIFAGGLAILDAVFSSLEIEQAKFSSGALREGLLGEFTASSGDQQDTRTRAIRSLMARYHVDAKHAERVSDTAIKLWRQLASELRLPVFTRRYLQYAALTHEVGLNLNSSGLQKHSAYILEHSNLAGFSFDQQKLVALMVRLHRKKIKKSLVTNLGMLSKKHAIALILILRLSVIWHLSRSSEYPEVPKIDFDGERLTLSLDAEVSEEYPLLIADLEREESFCKQYGIDMRIEFLL